MAKPKSNSEPRAERIWLRLIQCYGTRLAEAYGAQMPKPWVDACADFSDAQLAHGLRMLPKITPIHPPTLGQFIDACANMPIVQESSFATIQEQLCQYAAEKLKALHATAAEVQAGVAHRPASADERLRYSHGWTYLYREWWDATRPKGFERCAECVGVAWQVAPDRVLTFRVSDMQADAQAMLAVRDYFTKPAPLAPKHRDPDDAP